MLWGEPAGWTHLLTDIAFNKEWVIIEKQAKGGDSSQQYNEVAENFGLQEGKEVLSQHKWDIGYEQKEKTLLRFIVEELANVKDHQNPDEYIKKCEKS